MLKHTGIGLISASLLLAGCGGGSSSTATTTYDGPTAVVVIDETNADTLAGIAAEAALSGDIAGSATSFVGVSATPTTTSEQTRGPHILSKLAKQYADIALSTKSDSTQTLAGISESDTIECTYGGSITMSATYSNPNTFTSGDKMSMVFNDCRETNEVTYQLESMNGSMTLVFSEMDLNTFDFTAQFSFSDMKSVNMDTGDYSLLTGGFTASITGDETSSFVYSLYGKSLLLVEKTSGVTEQMYLTDFSFVDAMDSGWNLTFDHDFTIASTDIGGSIHVETTTPFKINYGDYYPSAGTVIVTGANAANIRLTALADATNVFIEYDMDGVSGYETSKTELWVNL